MKKLFTLFSFLITISCLAANAKAADLSPNSGLFSPQGTINAGAGNAEAPDSYQNPQSRVSQNQVPEKLEFVFQGHRAMGNMGGHFVSDVQTLLRQIEDVNQNAWNNLSAQYKQELNSYQSVGGAATLASVPAGGLAIAALDNAGGIAKQNLQFGIPFLFEGLGKQDGGECQGTVKGMLEGNCTWGTPPKIESAVFANIIGQDVNLNQLGGAYEVWGVAPARATLINLIFNEGLFK